MLNILQTIISHKQDILSNIPLYKDLKPSKVSFAEALSKPEFGFIFECKKASPSKGLIREDFDISEIISVYDSKADAISVLTEDRFFRGSFQYLKQARELTNKPLLCKDFILEPRQVLQARHFGADAILLMMSVLNDFDYAKCAAQAKDLNMDVLTEVHNKQELDRALALGAKIIGINNRNLKDLTISLSNTEILSEHIPDDVIVVTESGISGHQDVQELAPFADACLVGSHLMASDNLQAQVNELVFGDVKICGVTNLKDFERLTSEPCNSLGIILTKNSKRFSINCFYDKKTLEKDTFTKELVGVFQNQEQQEILKKIEEYQLDRVQLHGNENAEYITNLKASLPEDISLSKSISASDLGAELDFDAVDEYLVDTLTAEQSGGSGVPFDWNLLLNLPLQQRQKLRIAGGLSAENIQKIKSMGVSKLDICSGSEESYGIKSFEKIDNIFQQCRVLARQRVTQT